MIHNGFSSPLAWCYENSFLLLDLPARNALCEAVVWATHALEESNGASHTGSSCLSPGEHKQVAVKPGNFEIFEGPQMSDNVDFWTNCLCTVIYTDGLENLLWLEIGNTEQGLQASRM